MLRRRELTWTSSCQPSSALASSRNTTLPGGGPHDGAETDQRASAPARLSVSSGRHGDADGGAARGREWN